LFLTFVNEFVCVFTDVSTDQRCKVVSASKFDSVIIQLLSINSRLQPVITIFKTD